MSASGQSGPLVICISKEDPQFVMWTFKYKEYRHFKESLLRGKPLYTWRDVFSWCISCFRMRPPAKITTKAAVKAKIELLEVRHTFLL